MRSKEGQGKQRTVRIKQLQQEYMQVTDCMCDFLAGFDMHGMCMLVYGSFVVIGMDFVRI